MVGRRLGTRLWVIADSFMLLLFAFAVFVQFNDPDPFRWGALYAAAAGASALALLHRPRWWFPGLIAAIAIAWAASIAPRVLGKVRFVDMFGAFEMKNIGVEESREMYGLLIIAAWMIVLSVRALRGRAAAARRIRA